MAQFSDEFRAEMLIELAKMKTKMEDIFEQTKMGLNRVFDEVIYNFKKKTIKPEEFKSCEEFQDPVDVDASSDSIKSLVESDWSKNLQSKGVSSLIQEPSSENETIESLKFNCRECLGFDWYNFLGEHVFMKFQRKLKDIQGSQCMVERQSMLSSKEYSDSTKNWDPYGFRLLVMDKCIAPWTARIGGFTWHSSYEEAMWFFLEVNGEYERRFNSEIFVSLDFTCAGMEFPYSIKQLHAQLIVVGLGYGNYNGWLSKGLIDMYSISIDNIMYPIALHSLVIVNGSCKSSNDNRVLGSQLATVYVAFGYSYDAFVVFDKLPQGSNLAWNGIFKGFIDACTELNYFEDCKKIWDLFWWNDRHDDMKYNVYVEGTMIDMFAKCGSLSEARQFFGVKEKGLACWSEMICGNVQREETFESFSIFKGMRFKGLRLDSVLMSAILLACGLLKFMKFGRTLQECAISMENKDDVFWSTLTTGYSQHCQYQENCQLYLMRKDAEIRANVIVAVSVLLVLCKLNLLKHGNELYDYILKKGSEYDGVVGAAMIEMFVNCKSMTKAKYIFRIMSDMDGTLWNLIIVGYSLNGEVDIAFQIFQTIWDFNLRSNSIIMVNSFPSCIKVGILKYGKEIHAYEIKNGFQTTIFVGNSLLDMHCKCGTFKLGVSIFNPTVDVTIVDCEEISQGVLMNKRSYKYVWVLEELKLEHERGATFDFALCMFETINCYCTIINASGHGDLIKNMIIGASHSQAGCATLIIASITSGFETSVLKLGMVVNMGSSRLTIDVKSIEMHHAVLQKALPGDNFGFNVENTFVKDLKRELVASNSKDDHAKEATNFTFQDIIMNHLGQIVPFTFYCYISHIVVKLAEVLTKVDRCVDKSLRKRPLLLDGVSGMFVRLLGCENCIHP